MAISELRTFGNRLRALRSSKQISQADLARLIGRHQSTIGPYERDEYMPARDIIERLAAALDSSPEYLCFGRSPHRPRVGILGRLTPLGTIETGTNSMIPSDITLPHDRVVGVLISDSSMRPMFDIGDMALTETIATSDLSGAIGKTVLAQLPDGRSFLRELQPAVEAERFDLVAYNAPTWHNVTLSSIRKCVGRLIRDTWNEHSSK